jgi:hypothetical protein
VKVDRLTQPALVQQFFVIMRLLRGKAAIRVTPAE